MKNVCTSISFVIALSVSAPASSDESSVAILPILERHCIRCHGDGGKVEGEVDLLALKSTSDLRVQSGLLEDLVSVLQDRRMPPEDEPPLSAVESQLLVRELKTILSSVLKTLPFEPTPIRRMNRFQYNNAVVDLLELDRDIFQLNERLLRRRDDYFHPESGKMPEVVRISSRPLSKDIDNQRPEGFRGVAPFPQDKRAEHGFDNRADHLTLSPLLMESFLQLSQTIADSPDLNPKECRSWDRWFAPPGQPERSPVAGQDEDEDHAAANVTGLDPIRLRLQHLLRRAFRRPVDPETLNRFTTFAEDQLAAGSSFEDTMRAVLAAVLSMPDFLYIYETDDGNQTADEPPGRQSVNDFELASRLAQFF